MKKMFWVIFGLFLAVFLLSGVFSLIGFVFKIGFGILGFITSFVWNTLFNPVVLVIIIIVLAYKLNKKSA